MSLYMCVCVYIYVCMSIFHVYMKTNDTDKLEIFQENQLTFWLGK